MINPVFFYQIPSSFRLSVYQKATCTHNRPVGGLVVLNRAEKNQTDEAYPTRTHMSRTDSHLLLFLSFDICRIKRRGRVSLTCVPSFLQSCYQCVQPQTGLTAALMLQQTARSPAPSLTQNNKTLFIKKKQVKKNKACIDTNSLHETTQQNIKRDEWRKAFANKNKCQPYKKMPN